MSSHVVVLDGVDKIKSSSNPQVELVVDDTINNINDLQTNKLDATAQAVDSAKLNGQAGSYYATATDLSNGLNSKLNSTAKAVDSDKLDGLQPAAGATGNTIVQRDANGDFSGRYINSDYMYMSHGASTRNGDTVFYSSSDNYIRKNDAGGFRTALSVYSKGEVDTKVASAGSSGITRRTGSDGYIELVFPTT